MVALKQRIFVGHLERAGPKFLIRNYFSYWNLNPN